MSLSAGTVSTDEVNSALMKLILNDLPVTYLSSSPGKSLLKDTPFFWDSSTSEDAAGTRHFKSGTVTLKAIRATRSCSGPGLEDDPSSSIVKELEWRCRSIVQSQLKQSCSAYQPSLVMKETRPGLSVLTTWVTFTKPIIDWSGLNT